MATRQQVTAAIQGVAAIAEAIRALGSVPSGELWARLMTTGMSFNDYTAAIELLKRSGLVDHTINHRLRWCGPGADLDRPGGTLATEQRETV